MHADPQKVRAIFLAAVENHTPDQWSVYLDDACGGDQEMRQRVEVLLRAHEQANSLLDAPLPPLDSTTNEPILDAPGTVIGPYKLLEQIGQGGFGVVFMAEQKEPIRRKVALKVLKPGMDTKEVIARFEAERQALALMDHVNIARVLDAGQTASGRPFFVMDLVKGVPITKFCDESQLTLKERLELFVHVCNAVQHAHQKGIIHRDIKPSNVMVTMQDGVPLVKVIDFGIAKALGQQLTDKTFFTGFAQMIGTPLYMSPEQAAISNVDVDTRSDIYSLGVLLYELLTGTTPLDRKRFQGAAYDEIRRIIREEEPPRPSTRLSGSATLPSVAAQRKLEPARLTKLVRGDLDWIVMKALEKERGRRYETANGLSRDIQRYLSDEAVEACPPSRSYRLRKFARKNRAVLLTAAVLLTVSGVAIVALVGLVVGLFYQEELKGEKAKTEEALQAEEKQRQRAEASLAKTAEALQAEEVQRTKADRFLYFNKMVLAEREWSANNLGNVKRLLQEAPPEQRGWEWRYLDRMSNMELARLSGHNNGVTGLAYSPNGKWLASASLDKTVKIWDAASHKEIETLKGHKDMVYGVAFSRDSKLLVSLGLLYNSGGPGDLKFWDTTTWKEAYPLQGPPAKVWDMDLSPDNRYVALATGALTLKNPANQPGIVTIWDLNTGQKVRTLPPHKHGAVGLAFSPDGRLATWSIPPRANEPSEIRIWDTTTGNPLLSIPMHTNTGMEIVFSPDGSHLAWVQNGRAVCIADSRTGQVVHTLQGHNDFVTALAYFPGGWIRSAGALLATAGADGAVKIWDSKQGLELRTLRTDIGLLNGLGVSPDGRRLAASGFQGLISIWDPHTGQDPLKLRWESLGDAVPRLAVSPNGKKVATGGSDRTARVWDAATGQCLLVLGGHNKRVTDVAFDPSGRLLTTADGKIRFWDLATGQLTRTLKAEQEDTYAFAFSRDSKRLATSFVNPKAEARIGIKIVSTSSGAELRTLFGHTKGVFSVAFSPDGERLISASSDDTAKVWNVGTGKALFTLEFKENALRDGACFSPKDRWVATSCVGGASVWDAATGKKIYDLDGHKRTTCCVSFSPDGQRLATASDDGTVKIWDAASGQELLTLRGHPHKVRQVVFSPDGHWLASSGWDAPYEQSLCIWEATPLTPEIRLQREAAAVVNRLAEEGELKDQMRARLREDPSLSEPLREQALTLAERHQEDPWRLNRASRLVVQRSGLDKATYQLALRQAETALRLATPEFLFHPDFHVTTNIGIAHYRLGNYPATVKNLTHSEDYYLAQDSGQGPYKAGTPWNLAFLAMAHHQLGDKEKAQALLDRVRELITDPLHKDRPDVQSFFREAKDLIEGKAPDPKQ